MKEVSSLKYCIRLCCCWY